MGCLYRRKKKLRDGTLIEVGPYWMKWYRNGTPFSESTHTEKKTEVERELKKRMGDVARGVPITSKVGRVKFDELLENLCNEYQANDRKSLDVLRIRCNKHLLPFFGGRRASIITTADIDRYIVVRQAGEASPAEIQNELAQAETEYAAAVQSVRTRTDLARSTVRKELRRLKERYLLRIREGKQKAGASNGTINRELAALQRAYTLAVQSGLLMAKPYIRTLSENNVRTGFFEKEHFTAINRHLPGYLKPVATVAYITGWRTLSELLPLEWRQVEFNGGTLRLDPGTTKNRDGHVFPLTQELLSFCRCHGIQLEAYSPLTRGPRLEHPVVAGLADKYQRSSAQILVRWALQHEVVAIPKATTRSHIQENISVFDFSISPSDMASLDSLNENLHLCWDPSGVT